MRRTSWTFVVIALGVALGVALQFYPEVVTATHLAVLVGLSLASIVAGAL
jgi:hypothetical protein